MFFWGGTINLFGFGIGDVEVAVVGGIFCFCCFLLLHCTFLCGVLWYYFCASALFYVPWCCTFCCGTFFVPWGCFCAAGLFLCHGVVLCAAAV